MIIDSHTCYVSVTINNCYTYITGVAVIIHTCTSVQDGCARFFRIGL